MRTRLKRFGAAAAITGLIAAGMPAAAQTRGSPAAMRPIAAEQAGFDPARLAQLNAGLKTFVDDGRVAGMVTVLGRHGRVVETNAYGRQSLATGAPLREDALFRIYSMTKPVTGVAMMILFEEGRWKLDDPISKHVPEFAKLRAVKSVNADGTPVLEDLERQPTMRELMTHSAGFGYGLGGDDPVNKAFREQRVLASPGLQALVDKVSAIPLLSQPGKAWRYSVAVDLQGYIVEKLSGQPLDAFMRNRIFAPLKMKDTAFQVPADKTGRLATLYALNPANGSLVEASGPFVQDFTKPPPFLSGGAGLVSTAADYARFCQMVLNGGELDGARILSPATVKLMSANHLPEGQGLNTDGRGGTQAADGPGFRVGVLVAP
jgi:CubicO group peptidase (beta-lactamase class C family)